MRKNPDAPPPILVDGPPVEPEEALRRWIAERVATWPRAVFRLPFTFAADESNRAALGVGERGAVYRLDDTALGISLADRLRQARRDAPGACTLWLSVRMGGLVLAPIVDPEEALVASVLAVHERVEGATARDLRARSQRGPDCLALRLLQEIHCARGPARCGKCAEAAARAPTPALLDTCPDGDAARPTTKVEGRGWVPFDVLRRFASVDEARAFATRYELTDVQLDA